MGNQYLFTNDLEKFLKSHRLFSEAKKETLHYQKVVGRHDRNIDDIGSMFRWGRSDRGYNFWSAKDKQFHELKIKQKEGEKKRKKGL